MFMTANCAEQRQDFEADNRERVERADGEPACDRCDYRERVQYPPESRGPNTAVYCTCDERHATVYFSVDPGGGERAAPRALARAPPESHPASFRLMPPDAG